MYEKTTTQVGLGAFVKLTDYYTGRAGIYFLGPHGFIAADPATDHKGLILKTATETRCHICEDADALIKIIQEDQR